MKTVSTLFQFSSLCVKTVSTLFQFSSLCVKTVSTLFLFYTLCEKYLHPLSVVQFMCENCLHPISVLQLTCLTLCLTQVWSQQIFEKNCGITFWVNNNTHQLQMWVTKKLFCMICPSLCVHEIKYIMSSFRLLPISLTNYKKTKEKRTRNTLWICWYSLLYLLLCIITWFVSWQSCFFLRLIFMLVSFCASTELLTFEVRVTRSDHDLCTEVINPFTAKMSLENDQLQQWWHMYLSLIHIS